MVAKKLIPIKDPEDESITEPKKDKKDKINLPYNIKQLYIYGNNFSNNIQNTKAKKVKERSSYPNKFRQQYNNRLYSQ